MAFLLQHFLDNHLAAQGLPPAVMPHDGIYTLTVEERLLINLVQDSASGQIRWFASPGRLSPALAEAYRDNDLDPFPQLDDLPGCEWRTDVIDDTKGIVLLELTSDPAQLAAEDFDGRMRQFSEACALVTTAMQAAEQAADGGEAPAPPAGTLLIGLA